MILPRNAIMIVVAIAGLSGGALGAWQATATPKSAAQASYVRVCRDTRGVPDRRACRANDPRRTQLALTLPVDSAQ